ncbi:ATP phosphoribosyltransferase [Hazenella sp. IB182357]|uniref:ATP phosphoribosyltransferase n=1 Tax=Polycladospora coralii TaxID=2771432 RepID=A0A926RXP9_9BACL|nr:ATP phosphoribosyltransferase [Polycladospora coralii]MBD1372736.1 ATP phosphoribosyltransferase [Polycladospora coralii]MBS7531128.1 ATP phosphoribosyltransferase [Polycladospora coralii]
MTDYLTIAMPKGRIFREAVHLLLKADYQIPTEIENSRKLMIDVEREKLRFILAKPVDIPTYVEYGVADVGIAGKDVMLEEEREVHELLDLKISPCYIAVAGLPNTKINDVMPKVATKYPRLAAKYFREQGEQVEIIKLNGSIELAPIMGLAQRIVDIVSTGRTLKDNGLVEYDHIVNITSRLIVNPVKYRLQDNRINDMVVRLNQITQGV